MQLEAQPLDAPPSSGAGGFSSRRGSRVGLSVLVRAGSPTGHDRVKEARKPVSQGHDRPGSPARHQECRPAVDSANDRPCDLFGRLAVRGLDRSSGPLSQGYLAKFALGPARTRGPDPHAGAPELITQALHQTVDRVLARDVDRGVAEPDEAQHRGNLKNLAAFFGASCA